MSNKEKEWNNMWVCSPPFQSLKPLALLHREWDSSFRLPEHREDLKNSHAMFRKTFNLPKQVKKAVLHISGDDHYILYVNGFYITQGPANSYAFCYYYNQVDTICKRAKTLLLFMSIIRDWSIGPITAATTDRA